MSTLHLTRTILPHTLHERTAVLTWAHHQITKFYFPAPTIIQSEFRSYALTLSLATNGSIRRPNVISQLIVWIAKIVDGNWLWFFACTCASSGDSNLAYRCYFRIFAYGVYVSKAKVACISAESAYHNKRSRQGHITGYHQMDGYPV